MKALMPKVDFDRRAVRIDGQRKLLISGAIHYPRSTPQMWPQLFARSRAAGLNAIETYVFWNLHERERGKYDFTGRLDIERFCREAQKAGLHVVLRIGPYVCAETNFGGLPSWLRDVPGIQMRTENAPFQAEMGRFVKDLCDRLAPLFAPKGGPIVLAQVENEYNNISKRYGEAGARYLDWCVEMGKSLNLGIPWIMCLGAAEGAIETINGFYAHELIDDHFKRNPTQPALWTEAYPGWYDTWGYGTHKRTPEDLAFAAAAFFAAGGTGINYYMWHGGTNFARETMYLQTTAYFPHAPLDEFGQETTMSQHLARLHHILHDHAEVLLADESPTCEAAACGLAITYGHDASALHFLSNTTDDAATITFKDKPFPLEARSMKILDAKLALLMDTAVVLPDSKITRSIKSAGERIKLIGVCPEPFPIDRTDTPIKSPSPLEQLSLTHDESDYCWYSTTITGGNGELLLDGVADFVRIFIDGKFVVASELPLIENRVLKTRKGFQQIFKLDIAAGGPHRLDILCCALGLIKGDWMLDANMVEERKGLFGDVKWIGESLHNWEHRPGLIGESKSTAWKSGGASPSQPAWWKMSFARPSANLPMVLDLSTMDKGLAWLNGHCIGRYWTAPAAGRNPISPGKPVQVELAVDPTQTLYHVPAEWMRDQNELILFDESGRDPSAISILQSS